jgi:hypothetical protein
MAWLSNIFSRKKTLAKISLDELRREQIRITQEERKLISKVEEAEKRKREMFIQGKNEHSETKRRIIARDFKVADSKAQHLERSLQIFSKQIRILNGFVAIKENEQILKKMGVSKLINSMDLVELQRYVEEASTEGEFMMEKFSTILGVMEEQEAALGELAGDKDIEEIMNVWREYETVDDEEKVLAEGMKKLEKKKEPATEDI